MKEKILKILLQENPRAFWPTPPRPTHAQQKLLVSLTLLKTKPHTLSPTQGRDTKRGEKELPRGEEEREREK